MPAIRRLLKFLLFMYFDSFWLSLYVLLLYVYSLRAYYFLKNFWFLFSFIFLMGSEISQNDHIPRIYNSNQRYCFFKCWSPNKKQAIINNSNHIIMINNEMKKIKVQIKLSLITWERKNGWIVRRTLLFKTNPNDFQVSLFSFSFLNNKAIRKNSWDLFIPSKLF